MPETVTVLEDQKIIHVVSIGDITYDDLQETLAAVLKLQQERGINRVLVDATRQESFPDTMPVFEFGEAVPAALGDAKIAIAISPRTWEAVQFFSTVARNRGANVEMFDTTDEALKWLRKG